MAYDDNTHKPQYLSGTPEAFHSDVTHCFSVNMSSEEEDVCVVWWMRVSLRMEVTRREYWVHPYFN